MQLKIREHRDKFFQKITNLKLFSEKKNMHFEFFQNFKNQKKSIQSKSMSIMMMTKFGMYDTDIDENSHHRIRPYSSSSTCACGLRSRNPDLRLFC
jgi:hypothetical protein